MLGAGRVFVPVIRKANADNALREAYSGKVLRHIKQTTEEPTP